ncbi:MAG: hypothetical protein OJF49_003262 [Ktedonobacterales bacterium]|jgi:hypothetical protein|nr:MAG: hypothetical protein OJF49_003262 [Ktedonobacterales bacterium]
MDPRRHTPPISTGTRAPQPATPPATPPAHLTLAHWLLEAQRDSSPDRLWQLFLAPTFARLWYGARESGEMLRAWALEWLHAHQRRPGGPHPDPREPAAFSPRAILNTAAGQLGIRIWQAPASHVPPVEATTRWGRQDVLAWLITHPNATPPDLAVRYATADRDPDLHFAIACLLGFVCKERARLTDPDAPAGVLIPPRDPAITTILHQFAIGLLCLPRDCPPTWSCPCNQIRARFNYPPPTHDQPTDTLDVAAIRTHLRSQPHPPDRPDPPDWPDR